MEIFFVPCCGVGPEKTHLASNGTLVGGLALDGEGNTVGGLGLDLKGRCRGD